MKQDLILGHLKYGLGHLDALCWLCRVLDENRDFASVALTFDGQVVIQRSSLTFIQNPIAETGLIYCRKLLEFLGVKLVRRSVELCDVAADRTDDDLGIEHLDGLNRISVDALDDAPFGEPAEIRKAVIHTLLAANKGVAHFTHGKAEPADTEPVLICARTVIWLVERHVYDKLGLDVPKFRVWTAPEGIGEG
jgi:hypothetical protein